MKTNAKEKQNIIGRSNPYQTSDRGNDGQIALGFYHGKVDGQKQALKRCRDSRMGE